MARGKEEITTMMEKMNTRYKEDHNKGQEIRQCIIMAGNPGAGKSTLLNGLIGKYVFLSGINTGEGLTQNFKMEEDSNGNMYGDTPGLSCVKKRRQAAQEISDALGSQMVYKLFFVVTLQSGRVMADDLTTMTLILDALPKNSPYGIIVNQVSERMMDHLTDTAEYNKLKVSLNVGESVTQYIYLNNKVPEYTDQDGVIAHISDELHTFIKRVPALFVDKDEKVTVDAETFEQKISKLSDSIAELLSNNTNLETALRTLQENIKAKDTEVAKLHAEIKSLRWCSIM